MGRRRLGLVLLIAAGCKTSSPAEERRPGSPVAEAASLGEVFVGAPTGRPARLHLPPDLTQRARPLVIALHGYGDRGERYLDYLGYRELARREGFFLTAPDGTLDRQGLRFWNAGDACCNFHGSSVDDVAYLGGLIREVGQRFPGRFDPARVFLIGLSNGGFMAYRLACEGVPIAALISIAGAGRRDEQRCAPRPGGVSLLQVHSPNDRTVLHAGGSDLLGLGGRGYPGARASVLRWARLQGCKDALQPDGNLDLEPILRGAETVVERVACPPGGALDLRLWTVRGAPHVPDFGAAFARESWKWLSARRLSTR